MDSIRLTKSDEKSLIMTMIVVGVVTGVVGALFKLVLYSLV